MLLPSLVQKLSIKSLARTPRLRPSDIHKKRAQPVQIILNLQETEPEDLHKTLKNELRRFLPLAVRNSHPDEWHVY